MVASFVACADKDGGLKWGKTKYFKDSILKKYTPVVMSKTLNFSLNEDGQDLAETEFSFSIYEEMPNGKKVIASNVTLYKNGVACPDNILRVKGGEGDVVVGVEFSPDAAEGYHKLFLKEQSLNGLDRIDYVSLGEGFIAEKTDVMNPANELTMWVLIVLASFYVAWVLLLRPIFCPYVKFTKVDIYYPDNAGEVQVRTRGFCNVILTNKPIKQSVWSKIFFVQDKVEVNEVWTQPVKIASGSKLNLKVYTRLDVDTSPLDMPERRTKFHIINDENQKIGIETW